MATNSAQKAIQQNMSHIMETNIDPKTLATDLFSDSVISEKSFRTITDRVSGMTSQERMLELLKDLISAVGANVEHFQTLLTILRNSDGAVEEKLAEKLQEAYDIAEDELPEDLSLPPQASSRVLQKRLGIADLSDIMTALETHSFSNPRWQDLGEKLGIPQNKLEEIEYEKKRVRDMLKEVLAVWLRLNYNYDKYGRPSWATLTDAIKSISPDVAENIRKAI